jgi:hypothetical protein
MVLLQDIEDRIQAIVKRLKKKKRFLMPASKAPRKILPGRII